MFLAGGVCPHPGKKTISNASVAVTPVAVRRAVLACRGGCAMWLRVLRFGAMLILRHFAERPATRANTRLARLQQFGVKTPTSLLKRSSVEKRGVVANDGA